MKSNIKNLQGIRAIVCLVVLVTIVELGFNAPTHAADSLYVGDVTDNTVKAFDANTGAFQGEFVKKGNSPIKGPRGILKHNGATGEFLGALVSHNDPNAPFAPRGIVLGGMSYLSPTWQGKGRMLHPVDCWHTPRMGVSRRPDARSQ